MCTQSCGNGTALRGRSCLDSYCCGTLNETTECNTHACPGETLEERSDLGHTGTFCLSAQSFDTWASLYISFLF